MVFDDIPERHSDVEPERCAVNFSADWGPDLRKFDTTHGLNGHSVLSRRYRDVLGRNESLAGHLGADLVSNLFEERMKKAFNNRSPSVISSADGNQESPHPSWINVLLEVDPQELGVRANGTHCFVQGARVRLTKSDCELIGFNVLQKMLDPWPHVNDIQAELDTIYSIEGRLREWKERALQTIQEDAALLHDLQERAYTLRHHMEQRFLSQADDSIATTQVRGNLESIASTEEPSNIHEAGLQDSGTDRSSQTGDVQDDINEADQEGSGTLPAQQASLRSGQTKRKRWSDEENARLLSYISRGPGWLNQFLEEYPDAANTRTKPAIQRQAIRLKEKQHKACIIGNSDQNGGSRRTSPMLSPGNLGPIPGTESFHRFGNLLN
ncbi:hypothetical protein FE257_003788 [Aspergillus nanangensis]|uniref:Myb-like domain-containing protein n=1 Tax=Aspergillus nanangensis TaxID=2582783 RepID=A0AAD4CBM7_ASPNN|nr:hypothetical protein FE257_003788 [Aspergillus nanangensis]